MARSGKYAFTDTLDNFLSHDTPGNFDLLHSLNINQVSPENIASANAITSTPQYTTPNPNLAAYRRTVDNYELGPSNDANLLAGTVRANILEAPTYNAANFVAVSGGASWFGGFIATTTGKIITGIIVTLIIGGVVAGVLLGTRGKESALAVEVTTVAATPAVNYTIGNVSDSVTTGSSSTPDVTSQSLATDTSVTFDSGTTFLHTTQQVTTISDATSTLDSSTYTATSNASISTNAANTLPFIQTTTFPSNQNSTEPHTTTSPVSLTTQNQFSPAEISTTEISITDTTTSEMIFNTTSIFTDFTVTTIQTDFSHETTTAEYFTTEETFDSTTTYVSYTSTEEYTTETGSGFLVDATTSSAGGVVRRRKRENIFDDVLLDGEAIDYLNGLIGG